MGEFHDDLFDKMGGVFDLNQKVTNKDIILYLTHKLMNLFADIDFTIKLETT